MGRWKYGKALSFDGNDYVSIGDSASLDTINDLTVELWLKPAVTYSASSPDFYALVSKFNGAGGFQFVYHQGGYLYLYVTNKIAVQSSPVTLNAGIGIISSYLDSGTNDAHIYLGTSDITAGTTSVFMSTNNSSLFIGARPEPSPMYPLHFVQGVIDEVRIWGSVLVQLS